jgi:hypothetical protein
VLPAALAEIRAEASDAERVAMLELAFRDTGLPVVIDRAKSCAAARLIRSRRCVDCAPNSARRHRSSS